MVTLQMIVATLGTVVVMFIFYLLKLVGYIIAIPLCFITIGWLIDHFRGTSYTEEMIAFMSSYIPKKKQPAHCKTCTLH